MTLCQNWVSKCTAVDCLSVNIHCKKCEEGIAQATPRKLKLFPEAKNPRKNPV